MVQDSPRKIGKLHALLLHLVEYVLLLSTGQAVTVTSQFRIVVTYLVKYALAVCGIASAGVVLTGERSGFLSKIEITGKEPLYEIGHPSRLSTGLVMGYDGASCRIYLRVGCKPVPVAAKVSVIYGCVIIHINQNVTLGFGDTAVTGIGESLSGLNKVSQSHIREIGTEPFNLLTGTVSTVVVHQHNFILCARESSLSQTLKHIVDVLVTVVCTDNDRYHFCDDCLMKSSIFCEESYPAVSPQNFATIISRLFGSIV